MCFVLGFSIIFGSTLSVSAYSSSDSLYGGTYLGQFTNNYSVGLSFDKEQFQNISSISGSVVTPSDTTAGSYGPVTGSISLYSPSSTGSQSGSFTIRSGTISDYGHTDSVSLSVNSSNGVNYLNLEYDLNLGCVINSIQPNKYYEMIEFVSSPSSSTGSVQINTSSLTSYTYNNYKHSALGSKHFVVKGSDFIIGDSSSNKKFAQGLYHGKIINPTSATTTLSFTYNVVLWEISKEVYDDNAGTVVNDSGSHTQLEESNDIAQENTDTNKDTNNKVTNFFNGFWDNLLHIFVPEDGFFSDWFNELNDFFAAKLGFLYAPFDFIISFFNGVLNTVGTQEHGFTIPALSWEGTEFCPEVQFSFDMFADEFPQLQEAVYFFSDVVIILALMRGIRAKLDLVMGVHEE